MDVKIKTVLASYEGIAVLNNTYRGYMKQRMSGISPFEVNGLSTK